MICTRSCLCHFLYFEPKKRTTFAVLFFKIFSSGLKRTIPYELSTTLALAAFFLTEAIPFAIDDAEAYI